MDKFIKLLSFSAISAMVGTSAYAVSQGPLFAVSNGSFDVQVEIPAKVRISNLDNFNFGQFGGAGSGDFLMDRDVCVYTNTPAGRYRITATGDGIGSTFAMTNTGTEIPYQSYWNDTTGLAGKEPLTSGTPLTNRTGANATSEDCSVGGNSANIQVIVGESDMVGKPNGTYTGVLTILIEPE